MNPKKGHVIAFSDMWEVFLERWKVLILIVAIAVGGMFAVTKLTFTPRYQSTATLYILRRENSSDYSYSSSDFTIALNVVNDCTYLLKSHAVLDEVIEKLQLDTTYLNLYRTISTKNPSNTRILEVTVETEDLALSKRIVDQVCTEGVQKINEAMGFNQVNFYEYGTMNPQPSNKTGAKTYLIVAMITGVLAYFLFLVIAQLDDSLETKEEIEQYLGISVIGEIPNFNENERAGYEYRKKRYGYGYGYGYRADNKKKASSKGGDKA
ncbi:MAG: Wzz/FepE/Etk N-terminal domain-containing protein [Lachnospiraceae bacterium]|nr:Wzz/FepE/Etk N-terminal domain-containing protein [Lachnospiraceae bacterium]